jgi:hypothetical protein
MDVHRAFQAFQAARRDAAMARDLLEALCACASSAPGCDAHQAGVELARRRLVLVSRRLESATLALTAGRPLDEVLWSLPDDI